MAVETISAPLSEEVITSETPKIPNITSSSVLLVKPPPDIRAVVDRTALFVSKNGRTFEQRILNSAKGKTPKFAFLYETSPFHAYYESRISFYSSAEAENPPEEDKTQEDTTSSTPAAVSKETPNEQAQNAPATEDVVVLSSSTKTPVLDPVSRELIQKRQQIQAAAAANNVVEPPQPFTLIHIAAPSSISSAQIEIIKVCAQFSAMARFIPNESTTGASTFLNTLKHREWQNSNTFGFLQPRHAHFAYFTALVDAYYKLLLGISQEVNSSENFATTTVKDCLSDACYRAEYARYLQSEEAKKQGDDINATAIVDWHDFVVVETIDFAPNEVVQALPPPPPPPPPTTTATSAVVVVQEEEEDDGETIHIVSNYTPRVVATTTAKELSNTIMIDPITGKSIPVANLSEHMRIQLLDPKWALEKKRFQEKQRDSNLLSQGEDIANNIRRLYQNTSDATSTMLVSEDEAAWMKIQKEREEKESVFIEQQKKEEAQKDQLNAGWMMDQTTNMQIPSSESSYYGAAAPPIISNDLDAGHKRALNDADVAEAANTLPIPKKPRTDVDEEKAVAKVNEDVSLSIAVLPPPSTVGASVTPVLPQAPPILAALEGESPTFEDEVVTPWIPPKTITLTIRAPPENQDTQMQQWGMKGQSIVLFVEDAQERTVKSIKENVHQQLGGLIPLNKMQLKIGRMGQFLKDAQKIGQLEGITDAEVIDLVPKVRGGRK